MDVVVTGPSALTIEQIQPLRTISVDGKALIEGHVVQVRMDGGLEVFRIVRNMAWLTHVFEKGAWQHVRVSLPTEEETLAMEIAEKVQMEASREARSQTSQQPAHPAELPASFRRLA